MILHKTHRHFLEKNDIKKIYKSLGSMEKNSWNSFISDISSELSDSANITVPTDKLSKIMKKVITNVY